MGNGTNGTFVNAGQTTTEKPLKSGSKGRSSKGNRTSGNMRQGNMEDGTGTNGRPHPDLSSMQPVMQESGAMAAPGAHGGG
jgi:hypothetical protein